MGFFDWLDVHPGWGFVYLAIIMLCLLGMVSAVVTRGKKTASMTVEQWKATQKAIREMGKDPDAE